MTTTELERRQEHTQPETFIVAKTEEGYRVYSPLAPANQWLVRDTGDDVACTCPDFQHHAGDPEWRCKHIIAVQNHCHAQEAARDHAASAVPVPVSPKDPPPKKSGVRGAESTMLIKRSLSPDGRIDSLSVEFSLPVGKISAEEIKQQAATALKLQSEIMQGFAKDGNGAGHRNSDSTGAVSAQLLNVAAMDTRKGRSLFINVFVNNQVAKFFGDEMKLREALTAAGYPEPGASVAEGLSLNLPCRAVTKQNGKYLNIERLLPAAAPNGR